MAIKFPLKKYLIKLLEILTELLIKHVETISRLKKQFLKISKWFYIAATNCFICLSNDIQL